MSVQTLRDPHGTPVYYTGIGPEGGPLPAFIYFSLSGEESLSLAPYNHPVQILANEPLRIFSFDIPAHGGNFDKHRAMQQWADWYLEGEYFLEFFFQQVTDALQWLIETEMVDPTKIAVGGLSRGGFIATHIAARDMRIHTLLCFAPLTQLNSLSEFKELPHHPSFERRADALDLKHLVEKLIHLKHTRFYIGNHDTRVGTDACYHFIRSFSEKIHEKKARHCAVELNITHSIGHKGHGTAPQTFEEGAQWVKKHLLGS